MRENVNRAMIGLKKCRYKYGKPSQAVENHRLVDAEHPSSDLVIQALLTAVRKRRPKNKVLIHSDQGGQFDSGDWIRFCRENAAMESFFGGLKKERIRRKTYRTREEARSDVFDYIEAFYSRKLRHKHLGGLFPVESEKGPFAS